MKMIQNNLTDEQKKPYLQRIHAHPAVKKLFVVNEILSFFEWILWMLFFAFFLMQLKGVDTGADNFDIKMLYASMLQSKTGIIILGTLLGVLIIYKIVRKTMRAKLTILENKIYYELLREDTVAGTANDTSPQYTPYSIIKTVQTVITLVMVVLLLYNLASPFLFNRNNNGTDESPGPYVSLITLDTPTGLSFDPETSSLSWNPVENALSYQIDHNGSILEVTGTSMPMVITTTDNTFKVKAVGDNSYYKDSDWSTSVTYRIEQSTMSIYEKVNMKLGQTATERSSNSYTYELISVIGISWISIEENHYGENIVFETLCKRTQKNYPYKTEICSMYFGFSYPNATSASDILNDFENATWCTSGAKKTVSYEDAAEYFLMGLSSDSNYTGELKLLLDSGYSITPVLFAQEEGRDGPNYVGHPQQFYFEIIATYKAEKGTDVKYFTARHRITILNKSSNDSYNYVGFLAFVDTRRVSETYFVLHEEHTTLPYMTDWIKTYDRAGNS